MISVENLKVEFGTTPLFSDVSFVVNDKDRIALVGKNGAGKSTLMKILVGKQQPTEGVVSVSNNTTIGYLPQVMVLSDAHTVMEDAETAFANIREMQEKVEKLNKELVERTDYESESYMELVERFTRAQEEFQMAGGENYRADIERTLLGLGFTREDFDRPTSEFSGGWRMRIELAKLLLGKPDVLLLDEPTNHLDIESIQWLENFLINRGKALVLISHDRAFINNVTNRTIEITCGRIYDYKVKYDEFVKLREERREQQLHAYENQQKKIADIKAFIERFRYKPTKAVQVQMRIKQLEKIVPIEVDEVDTSALRLKFPPCLRSGDYPVICDEVRKAYGSHVIFDHVSFRIKRGEKVAFVGKNGEGKSTLVKCIMGQIPYEGNLKVGHNVQIGYFAQNQAQLLDGELSIYDTIDQVAKGDIRLKINNILGAFMFGGEISEKKVKVLSGGERSRLAMIRLLLEPVNLLILDEPTNHLDIRSKEVLKQAIREFDGTAIIVSHDREFLDGLVTKVYEFGGGKVREHLGGIYDFLQSKNIGSLDELQKAGGLTVTPSGSVTAAPTASPAGSEPASGKTSFSAGKTSFLSEKNDVSPAGKSEEAVRNKANLSYAEQKERAKALRKKEKEVAVCEENIARMEQEQKELEVKMAAPEGASDATLFTRYDELKKQISRQEEAWEQASLELEEMKAE